MGITCRDSWALGFAIVWAPRLRQLRVARELGHRCVCVEIVSRYTRLHTGGAMVTVSKNSNKKNVSWADHFEEKCFETGEVSEVRGAGGAG